MNIKPFFRFYDVWIGAYFDIPNRAIYLCPIPMFGVKIQLARKPKSVLKINGEIKRVCYEDKSQRRYETIGERDDPC